MIVAVRSRSAYATASGSTTPPRRSHTIDPRPDRKDAHWSALIRRGAMQPAPAPSGQWSASDGRVGSAEFRGQEAGVEREGFADDDLVGELALDDAAAFPAIALPQPGVADVGSRAAAPARLRRPEAPVPRCGRSARSRALPEYPSRRLADRTKPPRAALAKRPLLPTTTAPRYAMTSTPRARPRRGPATRSRRRARSPTSRAPSSSSDCLDPHLRPRRARSHDRSEIGHVAQYCIAQKLLFNVVFQWYMYDALQSKK
jgi:hypothetical protein